MKEPDSKNPSSDSGAWLAAEPIRWRSAGLALLATSLWGGNVVALKIGLDVFPPLWSAWWRFVLGVGVVWLWASIKKIDPRPQPASWPWLLLLGLMFTGQITLLNFGLQFTSPAYGVIILNSHPLFANLVAQLMPSEKRLNTARIAGLLIAFAGVVFLALGRPVASLAPRPQLGNAMLVASSFLLGLRMVYTRWLLREIEPVTALLWQMGVTLPIFLPLAIWLEPPMLKPLSLRVVLALIYQGVVVAGVCFVIWTALLRRHSAATLVSFSFTIPLFGMVFSWLVLGEPLDSRLLTAAAAVIVGTSLVVRY